MADKKVITKDMPPDVIEQDIARTRVEMSKTIDEIEERLSSRHWKAVAKETIGEKVSAAASRGKELAGRASASAQRFGSMAVSNSVKAKDRALQFVRENPTAVAVIAFELGVLAVIALDALKKRTARRSSEYAKAKIMSIEEVEQRVKSATMEPEEKFKKAA